MKNLLLVTKQTQYAQSMGQKRRAGLERLHRLLFLMEEKNRLRSVITVVNKILLIYGWDAAKSANAISWRKVAQLQFIDR